jgi:ATP-dependent RNA helicase DOB1
MNSNDLFSFLDDVPMADEDDDAVIKEIEPVQPKVPKKRKADVPSTPIHSNGGLNENEAGPSAQKKPRMTSPKPVVVDEFETEAKREVAASAGLTGGVEAGSRLELRHQVRLLCLCQLIPSLLIPW